MRNDSSPKAVIFDIGGVLIDVDHSIAVPKLGALCTADSELLHATIRESALLHRYESGQMTTEEFFDAFRELTGFRGGVNEFEAIFCGIFSPVEEMVAFHDELQRSGMPTYILSNTSELHFTHIRNRHPFLSSFAGCILSYEERCMKPGAGLYEAVERKVGLKGGDLLYIDDRAENVDAASRRGWRVIHHEHPRATLEQARRLLGLA